MELPQVLIVVGIPTLRSIAGWLNNALEDKKIDKFEWTKLVETIFRTTVTGVTAYYGINMFGLDIDIIAPIIGATLIDWIYQLYKPESKQV